MKTFKQYYEDKVQELDDIPKKPSANDDHWGYHLLMDMSGCNKNIDNPEKVRAFLKELVQELKMKPLGPPVIIKVDDSENGRGVTGVQVITTSTITFHGDDQKWCVYLDVFSCAAYEPKIVFDTVKKYFAPKQIGHKWIYRDAGEWPHKK